MVPRSAYLPASLMLCLLVAGLAACEDAHTPPDDAAPDWHERAAHEVAAHDVAAHDVAAHEAAADDDPPHTLLWPDRTAARAALVDGVARIEYPMAFRQLSFMIDADDLSALEYRVPRPGGGWTAWAPVEQTFHEGRAHNARVLLEEPTRLLELRGLRGVSFASFEFYDTIVARRAPVRHDPLPHDPLPHDPALPDPAPHEPDALRQRRLAVAPSDLVISRHEWGAIDPDKLCNSVVAPYRLTVHHTASPVDDGGDAAIRMRQMQNHHINSRGWCDIGYHFVVSQAGKVYQGRSRSDRPGAHVGEQNHGNVGVSFIGDFSHKLPEEAQLAAGAKIMRWILETHGIAPDRNSAVKGHREWPGQATACPGQALLGHLEALLERAGGDAPADPGVTHEVELRVQLLGLQNFVAAGSSAPRPDALPGQRFQAELVVTNASPTALRGVRLGYALDHPYVRATGYTIQTDSPARDRETWVVNDADRAPENPARDALGAAGVLTMYAFGAGETKRVLIDLEADQYSFGANDAPGVRAWVQNIDDVYGPQDAYNVDPPRNRVGRNLRAAAHLDVFSPAAWRFEGPRARDLEGWSRASADSLPRLAIDPAAHLLTAQVRDPDAALLSPEWTEVDADLFDQLVLRLRADDGPHVLGIYFARDDEGFSTERVVRISAPGDATLHTLVVPVGRHPHWTGTIRRLRIAPLEDRAPADDESGLYAFGATFFQSSATRETTSHTEPFLDQRPAPLLTDWTPAHTPTFPGPDGSTPDIAHVSSESGCSAAPTRTPADALPLVALLLALAVATRTRRPAGPAR